MASMDVPAGRAASVTTAKSTVVKPEYISWLTPAFMITASVASLRSAPTMAGSLLPVHWLGDDGGPVCENPGTALGKAALYDQQKVQKYRDEIDQLKYDSTLKRR